MLFILLKTYLFIIKFLGNNEIFCKRFFLVNIKPDLITNYLPFS